MTINELMIELSNYVQMGIDPDTSVVLRCEDYDSDAQDTVAYYCTESYNLCRSVD